MSMNATFVQVDSAELTQLQTNPSLAEALFQNQPLIPPVFAKLAQTMQERVRTAGPKVLADALTRLDSSIRKRLEERLGSPASVFAAGGGGERILQLMQERSAKSAQAAAWATAQRTTLSLDKAWHGVHYVLCGQAEPGTALLSQAVLGGVPLGDDDEGFSGYGPARYFTVEQVAEISQALSRPESESEAAARFDTTRMSHLQIYPGWRLNAEKEDQEWIMDNFRNLRKFYAEAAAKSQAIVTCLV